jgi:hypothetical protein
MRCSPGCGCGRHQSYVREIVPWRDKFRLKVDRRDYAECWPWTGAVTLRPDGYLQAVFCAPDLEPGRRTFIAPRVAFYLAHSRWPEPYALHGCDNSVCCNAENPEHVHEGTAQQNTAEMFSRGRGSYPPVLTGIEAGRARLTDEQAAEILVRYRAGGVRQVDLAAEYGVTQAAVSFTIRGKRRSLQ